MTERSSVLLVSNHGEIVGGGEESLLTLLKGLDRSRWAPRVVVPGEGAVAARCRALGLPTHVVPLPSLRWPGPAMLHSLAALRRLVEDSGATLLHANGSRAMFYAGLAGRRAARPVIWHLRILEPDPKLDWFLARLATRTIANSAAVRERLRRWPLAYERCSVVPNGLDLESFVPSRSPERIRQSLGLASTDRVVGTVGRLVPFKGHRYLLEAFAILRLTCRELRLFIVGDGPEREALERQARALKVAQDVHFSGHRADVADLLSVMEVFVLPSLAEHFGRVLVEAMAMERPVVATAAGGVPEVVEEKATALLVPPGDAGALAGAIQTLLNDPVRARAMGRAGRRRVEEHYTLRRHAEQIEAVYREVLGERA
jgi:glycosyltransferase involved in cell wall biosynthesis